MVRHAFVNPKSDGGDATIVRPSDWNANHVGLPALPVIGDPPSFSNGGDKDFRGAASLSPFTAVGTSSGTVTLHQTGASTNLYELTAAGLIVQTGTSNQVAEFRADYTLPDAQSYTLVWSPNAPQSAASDNMNLALRLNDNDTSSASGNYFALMLEQDTADWDIQGNSSADTTGTEFGFLRSTTQLIALRIVRDGTTYSAFTSYDGGAWRFVYRQTSAPATYSNIWISIQGASTTQTYQPVTCVLYGAEGAGGDEYFPWINL